MGPQRRLRIYVGYETSSIIRYIKPLTSDLFITRFADCHFDEAVFSELGGVKKIQEKDVIWCKPSLLYLDPRIKQCETEVQKIMHLQEIANQLPNAFTDIKRVTKSHIPAANASARVEIPNKQAGDNIAQESQKRLKRGRPIGSKEKILDRNEIGDIDEIFSYSVASDIMSGDDDPEPKSVFGPIVTTPRDVKPVGCKWTFVQKRHEKNEVTRYLISLSVSKNLEMRLMDVATAYLYGSIDNDIYMKIPEGFKIPDSLSSKPKEIYSIKLQRSLYGLKQSGWMWYNRLSDYLISKGYKSNLICPCVFIKKTTSGFVIIAVYVDDLNIIGRGKEINEVVVHLKEEFEMKDLEDEDVLGPETLYLSAIGALMYLTNCTRPDIYFVVNLLARFSSSPTKRHWNGIKHIFRYLRGTTDLGLFYSNNSKQGLIGYADTGAAISWRSQKQTLVATSSNHAEVITLHESSRECVWLRSMTQFIVTSYGLKKEESPTLI
ncbi:putative RNA-directed DNA polymerase [Tanacetum coccineum]